MLEIDVDAVLDGVRRLLPAAPRPGTPGVIA